MTEEKKPMTPNAIDLAGLRRHAESLAMQEWGPDALKPIGPHLTSLMPIVPACELQRRWHVIQTEPQQEIAVADRVEKDYNFDAFCPKEPKKVRVSPYKHRTAMRPMLPGYVFVGFDIRFDPWEVIRPCRTSNDGMRGVVRLLMIALRPVPILEIVIDYLRQKELELAGGRCRRRPLISMDTGTLVRILDPFAFAGLFGHIIEIDQRKHLLNAEIDIFGRKVKLSLAPEQVEAM